MIEELLDVGQFVFGYLHCDLPDVSSFSIPIGNEVFGFILRPIFKNMVILHPVLSKSLQGRGLG